MKYEMNKLPSAGAKDCHEAGARRSQPPDFFSGGSEAGARLENHRTLLMRRFFQ